MADRVQKIIAQSGLCSRRKAEELIIDGKVTVNGITITIGDQADFDTDTIKVEGTILEKEKKVYYMLNKPKRYIATNDYMFDRKTVLELVPKKYRVFSVGRLDRDATGFLILTNDGDFANKITHPRYEIEKTYIAVLDKNISKKEKEYIEEGIKIDEQLVKAKIVILDKTTVAISVHVGLNKVVKRIFKAAGFYVQSLHRTHIGNLPLDVELGSFRNLEEDDRKKIFETPEITKETFLDN